MVGRARELLCYPRNGATVRDRSLNKAKIYLGGGGNEASDCNEESACRQMAMFWAMDIVGRKWMHLDGAKAAE